MVKNPLRFQPKILKITIKNTELALFTTIDLIARSLAKCEFVTVENHKEVNKHEYYLWNYKPNIHQTKTEFVCDAVSNLIFKNECLIFETTDHQLLVADGFSKQEYAVFEDYKELQEIKNAYPDSIMSGSGSTYFVNQVAH